MKTALENFLTCETGDVFDYFVKTFPKAEYAPELYLWQDNGSPLTLVAHADTCRRPSKVRLHDTGQVITNKAGLLGADDRAGCYAIAKIIRKCRQDGLPVPNVLITDQEETGGVGARAAAQDIDFAATKTRLFVELDRQGANEYVFYSDELPQAIKSYVASFGYVEAYGSYSDIAEFTDCLIPAVNLSVGYYRQHTSAERLHRDELELTIRRVLGMVSRPIAKLHQLEPPVFSWVNHKIKGWEEPDDCPVCREKSVEEGWCYTCGMYVDDITSDQSEARELGDDLDGLQTLLGEVGRC